MRLPHSRRCTIRISGQVAMVIMVAHTSAGRKGRSTMKHEMMRMLRNSTPSVVLAKSTFFIFITIPCRSRSPWVTGQSS